MRPEPIQPNTAEWTAARRGVLTASAMADAMSVSKRNGEPLKARQDLIDRLVVERLTGKAADNFVTLAMQWGVEHEADAIDAYEIASGNLVSDSAFFLHPSIKFFGATPDRLVGADGLVEAKCPQMNTHYRYWRDKVVPPDYEPQVMTQLAVTGRKWCDFVSYHPHFPEHMRTVVVRAKRDEKRITEIESAASSLLDEVMTAVRSALDAACAERVTSGFTTTPHRP